MGRILTKTLFQVILLALPRHTDHQFLCVSPQIQKQTSYLLGLTVTFFKQILKAARKLRSGLRRWQRVPLTIWCVPFTVYESSAFFKNFAFAMFYPLHCRTLLLPRPEWNSHQTYQSRVAKCGIVNWTEPSCSFYIQHLSILPPQNRTHPLGSTSLHTTLQKRLPLHQGKSNHLVMEGKTARRCSFHYELRKRRHVSRILNNGRNAVCIWVLLILFPACGEWRCVSEKCKMKSLASGWSFELSLTEACCKMQYPCSLGVVLFSPHVPLFFFKKFNGIGRWSMVDGFYRVVCFAYYQHDQWRLQSCIWKGLWCYKYWTCFDRRLWNAAGVVISRLEIIFFRGPKGAGLLILWMADIMLVGMWSHCFQAAAYCSSFCRKLHWR